MDNILSAVTDCILKAETILFIAGAGLSADSGLPTYRGVGGLFEGVLTQEGIPIEEAISRNMLQTCPEVTWKYLWQNDRSLILFSNILYRCRLCTAQFDKETRVIQ
ncbi:hypothetical protein WJM97_10055 [Okeanomitos corallinicola TIOX110]|uniref:Deacetylase sirtuin-type domain-containing protein n=1 Tax=Okeanomitos corallinicola TIOX110 TaxID=3133117 RepID=A0ABZ2UYB1_9CYAN